VEADPTRMCELLVGLGDVDLEGVNDLGEGVPLEVVIRFRRPRPMCEGVWGACLVQGLSQRGAGGPTGVRPAGSSPVEETPLDMSEP